MDKEIINKIKSKKPLERLDDNFVQYFLDKFLNQNYKLKNKLQNNNLKKKEQMIIIKNVRNELNKIYGQFWIDNNLSLDSHKSTKERLNHYSYIYNKIFEVTGKKNRILDLAAGLNPLTYKNIKENYFIAAELTDYDCDKIREIFKKDRIKGEVIKINLFNYNKLPKADICFMFKLLDLVDHKLAEKLIKDANARYIIASFSTTDIKGRKMNYPRRGWFEIMLKRLNYEFTKFEVSNEIFYIVRK